MVFDRPAAPCGGEVNRSEYRFYPLVYSYINRIIRLKQKSSIFMKTYRFTGYFENEVLRKRPYLRKNWCINVIENPIRIEQQESGRFRFFGKIEELGGKILRVVTLDDKTTIHNAFLDRGYKE